MIRKISAVLISILICLSLIPSSLFSVTVNADVSASDTVEILSHVKYDQTSARKVLDDINAFRTGSEAYYNLSDGTVYTCKDLKPLRYDYSLEKIAMQRAAELIVCEGHTRPNGQGCFTVIYDGVHSSGENIAYASWSSFNPVGMWKEDGLPYEMQGHRRNLLSTCNSCALSCVIVDGGSYWVMVLGNIDPSKAIAATPVCDSEKDVKVEISSANISAISLSRSGSGILTINNNPVDLSSRTVYIRSGERYFPVSKGSISFTSDDPSVAIIGTKISASSSGSHKIRINIGNASGDTVLRTVRESAYAGPTRNHNVLQFVNRLYTVVLEREGDDAGLTDWTDKLLSGQMSGREVASGFFNSPEFAYKLMTDREFLKILYNTFFDREPDAAGVNNWMNAIYGGGSSWQDVFNAFAHSREWENLCKKFGIIPYDGYQGTIDVVDPPAASMEQIQAFSTRLYTTCLKRDPDETGIQYWTDMIATGQRSGSEVAYGFFFSDELTAKGLDDGEFVNRLYRTFFDREADPVGYEHWTGLLRNGSSRLEVFNGFKGSQEWAGICSRYGIRI